MILLEATVLARLRRHKGKYAFVLTAIAAASCLIVWTIGGYRTLFNAVERESGARYLGRYDVQVGGLAPDAEGLAALRGRPNFGGPFGSTGSAPSASTKTPVQTQDGGTAAPDKTPDSQSGSNVPGAAPKTDGERNRANADAASERPRYDPFKSARDANGSIDLSNLPAVVPEHIRAKLTRADANGDGRLDANEEASTRPAPEESANGNVGGGAFGFGGGTGGSGGAPGFVGEASGRGGGPGGGMGRGGRGAGETPLPRELIESIKANPNVFACDERATGRAFVFSPKANRKSSNNLRSNDAPSEDDVDESNAFRAAAPTGVDPDLHRAGLNAYRAAMGTPLGMGGTFLVVDAARPPYDLESGRWFDSANPNALEAVLPSKLAKDWNAVPGDRVLLLTKTREVQLEVVGVVADPLSTGLYTTRFAAKKILGTAPRTTSLGIELAKGVDAEAFKRSLLAENPTLAELGSESAQTAPNANGRGTGAAPTRTGGGSVGGMFGGRGAAKIPVATELDVVAQKKREAQNGSGGLFRSQATSGALLAILAAVFIVFTTLNSGVEEQKRQIALYRAIGLERRQIAVGVAFEALLLSIPGWIFGLLAGWAILALATGKPSTPDVSTVAASFACSVVGALAASFYPALKACRVKPMEAISQTPFAERAPNSGKIAKIALTAATLVGLALIAFDLALVYAFPLETDKKAAIQAGVGVLALSFGVLLTIPLLLRLTQAIFSPILAFLFRVDRAWVGRELTANLGRSTGVVVALSVGLGLYFSMQIWGYSMLGPFLPKYGSLDAFAAFLPNGLRAEYVDELKSLPYVDSDAFVPVAVEQAAFAPGSVETKGGGFGGGNQFANVILFGLDVDKTFRGANPLLKLLFVEGDPKTAFDAMKSGRGVVINDSVTIDFGLKLGDRLILQHPRKPGVALEYPIVGVVRFDGWQWLSKTSGVRRNFGRSGGIVFASDEVVWNDYQPANYSYFWFDTDDSRTLSEMETDFDRIARASFAASQAESARSAKPNGDLGASASDRDVANDREGAAPVDASDENAAYVKITTRASLRDSLENRANGVIWGMSTMPLTTLIIASLSVVGVVANSVRSRRWQFGIMRAVGVSRWALVRSIFVEALTIGIVAALASLAFGVLSASGALKLGRSVFGSVDPPLILPLKGVFVGFGTTFGLCLLAAAWPALRIGAKKPLELLQEGRGAE